MPVSSIQKILDKKFLVEETKIASVYSPVPLADCDTDHISRLCQAYHHNVDLLDMRTHDYLSCGVLHYLYSSGHALAHPDGDICTVDFNHKSLGTVFYVLDVAYTTEDHRITQAQLLRHVHRYKRNIYGWMLTHWAVLTGRK